MENYCDYYTFRKMKNLILYFIFLLSINSIAQGVPGVGYKPIILDNTYNHTKWGIEPTDLVYHFAAFTTSFDSDDDDNDDGVSDIWGVPEWVAYELKKVEIKREEYKRPKWLTDDKLNRSGIVPNDDTYAVKGTRQLKEVPDSYRFVRGHMCPKNVGDRISSDAGYNTHTVLNAVPQLQWQNNGIWKKLEFDISNWANKYEQVWVICGPIYFNQTPSMWLGQDKEVKAAIADAFFKIIIRKGNTRTRLETLSFIIPNIISKDESDYSNYLTSMFRIEELTGLRFLTELEPEIQNEEKIKHLELPDPVKLKVVRAW